MILADGIGGVICLHCSWQGDDRSPNNLRTHLKKFHSTDGVFAKFSEKLAQVELRFTFFNGSFLCTKVLLHTNERILLHDSMVPFIEDTFI